MPFGGKAGFERRTKASMQEDEVYLRYVHAKAGINTHQRYGADKSRAQWRTNMQSPTVAPSISSGRMQNDNEMNKSASMAAIEGLLIASQIG